MLHARIRNLLKYKERKAHDFKNQLVFEIKELDYTSIDEDFMQRAIDCVNRHLEDSDFRPAQFVEEMGTSKSTLYKKLKSLTGLNTSAFIRNIRLKAACRIMEEKGSSVRISDLAYASVLTTQNYFSSCFKKEFGMLQRNIRNASYSHRSSQIMLQLGRITKILPRRSIIGGLPISIRLHLPIVFTVKMKSESETINV